MNRVARKRLIDQAIEMIDNNMLPAVPMEDFFTGNTDDMSFGRHIQTSRNITIAEYGEGFLAIRARSEVLEIYVELREIPDDSDPEEREMWLSGFVIFVITSASAKEVEDWLRPLEPRYVDANWSLQPGVEPPWNLEDFPPGYRPVLVEML